MMEFESHVAGIPCIIKATRLFQPPSGRPLMMCESPDEAFGIDEIEFEVCDRKGYPAAWLEAKLTKNDRWRIEEEVVEYYQELADEAALSAAGH